MEVPRHLQFDDLSGTIKPDVVRKAEDQSRVKILSTMPASIEELGAQLSCLASKLQDAHDAMQERVDNHKKAALEQLEATGGRQALESHLKAQKANWKFIGQKEAFLDHLKALRSCQELLQHDFSSDIAIADKAVQALREEIRDRHAAVSKAEQELHDMIGLLTKMHSKGKGTAADLAVQLPVIAEELEEVKAKGQPFTEPMVEGMDEVTLKRLLQQEEARATQLEQRAAQEASRRQDAAMDYTMLEARVRDMREAAAAMEEELSAAAEKAGAKYKEELQRMRIIASLLSRMTGSEVTAHEDSAMHVTITQPIPRAVPGWEPAAGASASQASDVDAETGGVVVEHVLSLQFESPTCGLLRSAALNPPEVDIEQYVREAQAAKAGPHSLNWLVLRVKKHLRMHCRRQVQLEDAHELYPLQPTVSPELLRCVLPNKVEVEVLVPLSWPEDPAARVELVQLEAPRTSEDLAPLLERLQWELQDAYSPDESGAGGVQAELRRRQLQGCSLRNLLGWVYSSVEAKLTGQQ